MIRRRSMRNLKSHGFTVYKQSSRFKIQARGRSIFYAFQAEVVELADTPS